MIITKKIPVGANVTWEASAENCLPLHGSFIMPNAIKTLDIILDRGENYWTIFSGEGNPAIYIALNDQSEYSKVYSPVLKKDYNEVLTHIRFGYNKDSRDLITDITWLDTSSLIDTYYTFAYCHNLKSIPTLTLNDYMDMRGMFRECSSLENIPSTTLRPTNMNNMFRGCSSLKSIPDLNTLYSSDFNYAFSDCTSIETVPELNFYSAETAISAFRGCTNLKSVGITGSDNVTNASYMFDGCSSLTEIDINLSKVENASYLFRNCSELRTVKFRSEDLFGGTVYATSMNGIFSGCPNLSSVEGICFNYAVKSSSVPDLFGDVPRLPLLTHFIVEGRIDYSFSFTQLTNLDYASVKSILEAMNRTTNTTTTKVMRFNCTVNDRYGPNNLNGVLAGLVSSCTAKKWSITGLRIK